MSQARRIGRIEIDEHEHVTLMDRQVLNDGTYLTKAQTSSIQLIVYSQLGEEESFALDKNTVVADVLQTDEFWSRDKVGYNVKYTLDTQGIMEAGREYSVTLVIETVDWGPKYSQYRVKVRDVPGVS